MIREQNSSKPTPYSRRLRGQAKRRVDNTTEKGGNTMTNKAMKISYQCSNCGAHEQTSAWLGIPEGMWVRGKQENAMKVWNTARGYKGGGLVGC